MRRHQILVNIGGDISYWEKKRRERRLYPKKNWLIELADKELEEMVEPGPRAGSLLDFLAFKVSEHFYISFTSFFFSMAIIQDNYFKIMLS